MLGIGQISKLMKGDVTGDQIAELLGSMGLGADVTQLTAGQVDLAFQKLWESAQESGAVLLRVELSKKDGEKISGLLLMHKAAALPSAEKEPRAAQSQALQVA
jgi:hypothetical protein